MLRAGEVIAFAAPRLAPGPGVLRAGTGPARDRAERFCLRIDANGTDAPVRHGRGGQARTRCSGWRARPHRGHRAPASRAGRRVCVMTAWTRTRTCLEDAGRRPGAWFADPDGTSVAHPVRLARRSPASARRETGDGGRPWPMRHVTGTADHVLRNPRVWAVGVSYVGAGLRSCPRRAPGVSGDPEAQAGVLPSGWTCRQHRAGLRHRLSLGLAGTPRGRPVGLTTRPGSCGQPVNCSNGSAAVSLFHANAGAAPFADAASPWPSANTAPAFGAIPSLDPRSGPAAASRRPADLPGQSALLMHRDPLTRRPPPRTGCSAVFGMPPLRMARRRLGRVPPRHGDMIRLLRRCGWRSRISSSSARPGAVASHPPPRSSVARQWPCEEVWKPGRSSARSGIGADGDQAPRETPSVDPDATCSHRGLSASQRGAGSCVLHGAVLTADGARGGRRQHA